MSLERETKFRKKLAFVLAPLLSSLLFSGDAYFPTTYPTSPTKVQIYRRQINRAHVRAQKLDSLIKTFRVPKKLALLLATRDVEIALQDNVRRDFCNGVYLSVAGLHYPDTNKISLPKNYSRNALFHEIGHSLWDENDGIFSSFFTHSYSGASRNDFAKALAQTPQYRYQTRIILEQAAMEAYCKLLSKHKGTLREEVHLSYLLTDKSNPDSCFNFLSNAVSLGIDVKEEQLGERITNETFSQYFADWMEGKETIVDALFTEMRYLGKSLKE